MKKGAQVQLMGDVFEQAEQVLACVGPHEDESKLVVDVLSEANFPKSLRRINAYWLDIDEVKATKSLNNILQRQSKARFTDTHLSSDLHSTLETAYEQFFNREFWWRIWIVQEVRLAKALEMLCGSHMLDIQKIAPLCNAWISSNGPPDYFGLRQFSAVVKGSHHSKRDWFGLQLRAMKTSRFYAVVSGSHHSEPDQSRSREHRWLAHEAFNALRESKCADFRDRVYGVMRVIGWGRSGGPPLAPTIVPNYQITKLGLLSQVADDIISNGVDGIQFNYNLEALPCLYEALELKLADSEVSELVAERRNVSKESHGDGVSSTRCLTRDLSRTPIIPRRHVDGYQLISSSESSALKIDGCGNFFPYVPPLDVQASATLQGLQVKDKNDVRLCYWICPEARSGDYLLDVTYYRTPFSELRLSFVVRQNSSSGRDGFEVVGYAVHSGPLYHLSGGGYPSFDVHTEVDDSIAHIALEHDVRRKDFSADDMLRLLNTRPTRENSSTHAKLCTYEKAM